MRNINKSKFMRRFMHKLVGDATLRCLGLNVSKLCQRIHINVKIAHNCHLQLTKVPKAAIPHTIYNYPLTFGFIRVVTPTHCRVKVIEVFQRDVGSRYVVLIKSVRKYLALVEL